LRNIYLYTIILVLQGARTDFVWPPTCQESYCTKSLDSFGQHAAPCHHDEKDLFLKMNVCVELCLCVCLREGCEHASKYEPLQCVTVCCSVLQCVAVCCRVLQCVAVCCTSTNGKRSTSSLPPGRGQRKHLLHTRALPEKKCYIPKIL